MSLWELVRDDGRTRDGGGVEAIAVQIWSLGLSWPPRSSNDKLSALLLNSMSKFPCYTCFRVNSRFVDLLNVKLNWSLTYYR